MNRKINLDVVVPFYNEAECAPAFLARLTESLSNLPEVSCNYVLADDGSTDGTGAILDDLARRDPRIHVVHLWGNHGHQKAIIAGLDQCQGDAVLILDGDGQHPVETAVKMVEFARMNPDTAVIQALRTGRQSGFLKNLLSRLFYQSINLLIPDAKIQPGASDFRVLQRCSVDVLKQYPDRHRNLRVLLALLSLPTVYVPYEVNSRLGGVSKYRFAKMLSLAMDGWFAFSSSPLRISLLLMSGSALLGLAYTVYGTVEYYQHKVVPGWTSLIALMAFFFSAIFGVLAIMSEYIVRIYEDVRKHPVYRIRPESHLVSPRVSQDKRPSQQDGEGLQPRPPCPGDR